MKTSKGASLSCVMEQALNRLVHAFDGVAQLEPVKVEMLELGAQGDEVGEHMVRRIIWLLQGGLAVFVCPGYGVASIISLQISRQTQTQRL